MVSVGSNKVQPQSLYGFISRHAGLAIPSVFPVGALKQWVKIWNKTQSAAIGQWLEHNFRQTVI